MSIIFALNCLCYDFQVYSVYYQALNVEFMHACIG